jgi:coxsackievirus/adenovirus receptor
MFLSYSQRPFSYPYRTTGKIILLTGIVMHFKAKRIKQEADDLLTENESLLDDLRDQIDETKELLERGHSQQQIADELLADTDAAKAKAEEAVSKGDEILETAKNTLKTLQGWYKCVCRALGREMFC